MTQRLLIMHPVHAKALNWVVVADALPARQLVPIWWCCEEHGGSLPYRSDAERRRVKVAIPEGMSRNRAVKMLRASINRLQGSVDEMDIDVRLVGADMKEEER